MKNMACLYIVQFKVLKSLNLSWFACDKKHVMVTVMVELCTHKRAHYDRLSSEKVNPHNFRLGRV